MSAFGRRKPQWPVYRLARYYGELFRNLSSFCIFSMKVRHCWCLYRVELPVLLRYLCRIIIVWLIWLIDFTQFWKVSKVLKTSISWRGGFQFNKDQTKESDEEIRTRQYDAECMRYLSFILYPLCVLAAVYSLLYQPHKRLRFYVREFARKYIYYCFINLLQLVFLDHQ